MTVTSINSWEPACWMTWLVPRYSAITSDSGIMSPSISSTGMRPIGKSWRNFGVPKLAGRSRVMSVMPLPEPRVELKLRYAAIALRVTHRRSSFVCRSHVGGVAGFGFALALLAASHKPLGAYDIIEPPSA